MLWSKLTLLTLNIRIVDARHHRLVHSGAGEYQRTHSLHRLLHDNSRMILFDLILAVVHSGDCDAIVYRTVTFRHQRRVIADDVKVFLLQH